MAAAGRAAALARLRNNRTPPDACVDLQHRTRHRRPVVAASRRPACVRHSPSTSAVILHGGITPGHGRADDLCVGHIKRTAATAVPELRWERLTTSMVIPPRSYHGATVLTGAATGDRLLLFGGEGNPKQSKATAAAPGPAMMNDCWSIELKSGKAMNLIATAGTSPTPRTHITIAALKEPPLPTPKPALAKLRQGGLSFVMAKRSAVAAAAPASTKPRSNPGAPPAAPAPTQASGPPAGLSTGGLLAKMGANKGGGGGARWTVLVIGGRPGDGTSRPPEDSVHVLRLNEYGDTVEWMNTIKYLTAATRSRLQMERVRATSMKMTEDWLKKQEKEERRESAAKREADGLSPRPTSPTNSSPTSSPRGFGGKASDRIKAAAVADQADDDLAKGVEAGRLAFALLQRYNHSTVTIGSVAVVFGGIQNGKPTSQLCSVRFRDLATSLLAANGKEPEARYGHAACVDSACGMLISGGATPHKIFDDVHCLTLPSVTWSTLKMPSIPKGPPKPPAAQRVLFADGGEGGGGGEGGEEKGATAPPSSSTPTVAWRESPRLSQAQRDAPTLPGVDNLAAMTPMARHGHAMASISKGEIIVYGGYAATSTKLGRTTLGGFAPNKAYFLQHSTDAAKAAAVKARWIAGGEGSRGGGGRGGGSGGCREGQVRSRSRQGAG